MRSLEKEYQTLAQTYDRRWGAYVDRSLQETLQRLELASGARVLDIGCGTGELLRRLRALEPSLILHGVDPSAAMLNEAQIKLAGAANLAQAPAERLPFADASFDLAACTSILHYLPEPRQALTEIKRVLKPGGRLALTDWCHDYLACRLLGTWLRLLKRPCTRIYGITDCRSLLEREGFQVIQLDRYKISPVWGLMTAIAVLPLLP
jgi:ubiquinone/menaquinone biosynthesis C-methylase UbiE